MLGSGEQFILLLGCGSNIGGGSPINFYAFPVACRMALPPPKQFIQDMPPVGGFIRPPGFPAEAFRKRSPARGPSGVIMLAGAVSLTVWGMLRFLGDVQERK